MRILVLFLACCLTGCSQFELSDLNPANMNFDPPSGGTGPISLSMGEESLRITKSNILAVDGLGYADLPVDTYYGLGIDGQDHLTVHGGLTYRASDNLGFFTGFGVDTEGSNDIGLEYGAQFLMADLTLEVRRDNESELTLFGIGKEF